MNTTADSQQQRQRRLLALLALAACALTLVVIVASAFLRQTQTGLSCGDWPECYGRIRADDAPMLSSPGVGLVRVAHRLAATGIAVAILLMLSITWMVRPVLKRDGALAIAAILLVVVLAALGIVTPRTKLPAVVVGNLLGGNLLLAVLAASYAAATDSKSPSGFGRALAFAALAVGLGQVLLGGLIGSQYASHACPTMSNCRAWSWHGFVAGGAWNPLHRPVVIDGHVVAPSGAAALHVLHRLCAIAVATLALAVAALLRHSHPQLAATILGLVGLEAGLGFALVSSRPALAVAVLHNAVAAVLIATLSVAAIRAERTGSRRLLAPARNVAGR